MMVSVTLFLVSQTQAKRRVELGIQETASFKKETMTLFITLFSFSVGYGIRFSYDGYLAYYYEKREEWFASYLNYDIMSLVEGTTFMAVLLYHNKNFKIRKPVNDLTEQQIMEADSHSIDDTEALVYLQTSFIDSRTSSIYSVASKEEQDETEVTQANNPKKIYCNYHSINFEQNKGLLLPRDANVSGKESVYKSVIFLNSSDRSQSMK